MLKNKLVKIARVKADMKALELAKQAGISRTKLSLFENGREEITEKEFQKIVEILQPYM